MLSSLASLAAGRRWPVAAPRSPRPRCATSRPRHPARRLRAGVAATAVAAVVAAAAGAAAPLPADLALELVVDGLDQPVAVVSAGDDRLFVVERRGLIHIVRDGALLPQPFLDLRPVVDSTGREQGLLGLAFHPDHDRNGFFYVSYVRDLDPPDTFRHEKVIARYRVSADDPDAADPDSATILLTIEQPFPNHFGGDLQFGLDGTLYTSTGDGGGASDPFEAAQNLDSLLGKLLRLDVDRDDFPNDPLRNYGIPEDNPFASGPGADEIWAYGLRNPWRFSVDRRTGDLFVGDVGQNAAEEVNLLPRGEGGHNLGWDCFEGNEPYPISGNDACPPQETTTPPILVYGHTNSNCSITGGYRYRGHVIAGLAGRYLYGDYCTGRLWLAEEGAAGWSAELWRRTDSVTAFGEDARGELYVLELDGRLLAVTSPSSLFFDDFEDGGTGAWTRVVRGTPGLVAAPAAP